MILIDQRVGSQDLTAPLRALGMAVELTILEAADFAFEGRGPEGESIMVGIERKKVGDLLQCIDDGRYAGDQQHKMKEYYKGFCFLILEGLWRPTREGLLLVRRGSDWVHPTTSNSTLYSKLFSYLTSISLISGTTVVWSNDINETAHQISCIYKWFQKHWEQHTSQYEVHNVVLPQFGKPSFERRVASQIDGIGVGRSIQAAKLFQTVPRMINADEEQWMKIVGPKTAQKIVRQIRGKQE